MHATGVAEKVWPRKEEKKKRHILKKEKKRQSRKWLDVSAKEFRSWALVSWTFV